MAPEKKITTMKGMKIIGQEDLPTVERQQATDPRVPKKDEDSLGARDTETKKAERKKTPGGVVAREFTFSRSEKLRRTADFDRAYSEGKRIVSSSLVLFFFHSPSEKTRLGVSVSKKIGKAVVRNRVKRLLRETFRLNKHELRKGYDILLVARRGVERLKFREVEAAVVDLFRRGGLLVERRRSRAGDEPSVGEGQLVE